jgi:hypothetical protein
LPRPGHVVLTRSPKGSGTFPPFVGDNLRQGTFIRTFFLDCGRDTMFALGGIQFDVGYKDRRLLWRDFKADMLCIGLGMVMALGFLLVGAWILPWATTVKVLVVYVSGGALYGAVNDFYLKSRCKGDQAYPADSLYLVLTTLMGLGVLFLVRLGAGWAIGHLPPMTPSAGLALIYNVVSLFFSGTASGGLASHTLFERRYSVARWYRSGEEFGTRRRRIVFYMRPRGTGR